MNPAVLLNELDKAITECTRAINVMPVHDQAYWAQQASRLALIAMRDAARKASK